VLLPHWVDSNFELKEALLSFQHIVSKHDEGNLGLAIYNILDLYNIVKKLFCITADNASNNKTTLEVLQDLMLERNGIH
jgi:hypothetical protein